MRPRKICKAHGCSRPAFSHEYCDRRDHQLLRSDSSFIRAEERREAKKKEPKKAIPKRTSKRAEEEALYYKNRAIFLALPENQFCAVFPWLRATQVHHKAGRIGKLLYDMRFFLAVSDDGHRKIEMEPTWAKEMNFSIQRT